MSPWARLPITATAIGVRLDSSHITASQLTWPDSPADSPAKAGARVRRVPPNDPVPYSARSHLRLTNRQATAHPSPAVPKMYRCGVRCPL
jgi:hypothetical protein